MNSKSRDLGLAACGIAVLGALFTVLSHSSNQSIENGIASENNQKQLNSRPGVAAPGAIPSTYASPCSEVEYISYEHNSCMTKAGFVPIRTMRWSADVPNAWAKIGRSDSEGSLVDVLFFQRKEVVALYIECKKAILYNVTYNGEIITQKGVDFSTGDTIGAAICRKLI